MHDGPAFHPGGGGGGVAIHFVIGSSGVCHLGAFKPTLFKRFLVLKDF